VSNGYGHCVAEPDVFDIPGVDALFEGELETFVERREELMRRLKKDGEKDAAAVVKQLRKPTTVMWAVNQVARRDRAAIDDLVKAAGKVRAAQARAVQGKDTGLLRSTTNDWRNRVRSLAAEVGKLAGAQHRDDAAATFEAASTDDELADVLKAGRLISSLSPSGFGLDGMPEPAEELLVGPPPKQSKAKAAPEPESATPTASKREIADARRKLDERESALESVTHRLRRAEQRLEQAQDLVADATKARDAALAARDEAAAALDALG
jgi:hypothetical protein